MKAHYELQAGLFIVAAIVLLSVGIWILGQERQVFSHQQEFHTVFKDIQGLTQGASVRLGGIAIGRVSSFKFAPDQTEQRIDVAFLVNQDYIDRIREDSLATLQTQGLLGDRILNILPGKSEKRVLPGGAIPSKDAGDLSELFTKASTVVDNAAQISETLKDFLKNFDKQTVDSIGIGFRSLGKLAQEIEKGDGLLHRLVFSKKDGDAIMSDLKGAADSVNEVLTKIKSGDGILHALVYKDEGAKTIDDLTKAASSLGQAAAVLTEIMGEVKQGDGLVHDLVYGESPSGIDEAIAKLNDTINNLKVASDALARGSGTIGALLVDSQLYDNLVEVTDGAKRSFILRQAIRSALDKEKTASNSQ
ncbi:MAG: MlaD family protein [Oligoflexia bacterium]|nr:MlaD family protein [Oligoflexia bacterium]